MSRSRRTAREAGTRFETHVARYLAESLGWNVERRARTGAKDTGDISGLFLGDDPIVVECKDYGGKLSVPQWLREAEAERDNAGALVGVVVAKRRGVGLSNMGDQLVLMTLDTYARHLREAAK